MIVSEIKVSGIEDVEKRLGNMKKNAPTVVSRAINRAIQNVKKNMGKETSERYFITSGEVKRLSMSQKPQSHGFKPRQFRKVLELPCQNSR